MMKGSKVSSSLGSLVGLAVCYSRAGRRNASRTQGGIARVLVLEESARGDRPSNATRAGIIVTLAVSLEASQRSTHAVTRRGHRNNAVYAIDSTLSQRRGLQLPCLERGEF